MQETIVREMFAQNPINVDAKVLRDTLYRVGRDNRFELSNVSRIDCELKRLLSNLSANERNFALTIPTCFIDLWRTLYEMNGGATTLEPLSVCYDRYRRDDGAAKLLSHVTDLCTIHATAMRSILTNKNTVFVGIPYMSSQSDRLSPDDSPRPRIVTTSDDYGLFRVDRLMHGLLHRYIIMRQHIEQELTCRVSVYPTNPDLEDERLFFNNLVCRTITQFYRKNLVL